MFLLRTLGSAELLILKLRKHTFFTIRLSTYLVLIFLFLPHQLYMYFNLLYKIYLLFFTVLAKLEFLTFYLPKRSTDHFWECFRHGAKFTSILFLLQKFFIEKFLFLKKDCFCFHMSKLLESYIKTHIFFLSSVLSFKSFPYNFLEVLRICWTLIEKYFCRINSFKTFFLIGSPHATPVDISSTINRISVTDNKKEKLFQQKHTFVKWFEYFR